MIKTDGQAPESGEADAVPFGREIIIVENWFEELKRLAPVEGKP